MPTPREGQLVIRRLGEHDAAQTLALRLRVAREGTLLAVTGEEAAERSRILGERGVRMGGWLWGELVGEVRITPRRSHAHAHRARLGLWVDHRHRGVGIGSALLHEAVRWARQHPGLRVVELCTRADNLPAIRLYERFGFKEVHRRAQGFRSGSTLIDEVEMDLVLQP